MKKVIFVVSTLERSGTTTVLYNIVKNLDDKIFEAHILTLSKEPKNSRIEDFKKFKITTHCLNLSSVNSLLFSKRRIQKTIKQLSPDIIYSNGYRADYLISKWIFDKKILKISNLQADLFDNYIDTYGRIIGTFIAKQEYHALSSFDVIIPCSQAITEKLKYTYPNIFVIRNGVDTEEYRTIPIEKKNALKAKLGIPLDKRVYISVGSLSLRKDPITVLEGFIKSDAIINSWLIFLGDGVLSEECKNKASQFNQIKLLGNVNNVAEYLKVSDVIISASTSEGLPNSVMEGAACGLYCCVSDIPQHLEILHQNEQLGCSFKTNSSEDLTERINQINSTDIESAKGKRGIIADSLFSARKMSDNFQELFKNFKK